MSRPSSSAAAADNRPRRPGTAMVGGAIAGAATGAIDALWSLPDFSQFVSGAGSVRAVLFVAVLYALFSAIALTIGFAAGQALLGATRLGDLWRFASGKHAEVRAADPSRAVVGLSLAIAFVPVVAVCLGAALWLAHHNLVGRKHIGLVIAASMIAALVAVAFAVVATFVVARPVEALLTKLARKPALARPLSSPIAPAVAAAVILVVAAAVGAAMAWNTVSLLNLRPVVVFAVWATLLWPALRAGAGAWDRLPMQSATARGGIAAGAVVVLLLATLGLGASDGARKAATAYTGLGGPLSGAARTLFDFDRDGYSRVLGGGDCDDWDGDVNPGAAEVPDDGVDNNCVGGDATLSRSAEQAGFVPLPSTVPADLNVLLITIDTVRADHVGAYGYDRPTTPTIDKLAAEGTLFVNAWAHAPSTRYSIPAILTGKYPLAVDYFDIPRQWPGIADSNVTFAEILTGRGFYSGAIVNYWYFDKRRKMDQGFAHYDNQNKRLHRQVGKDGPAKTQGTSSKEQTDKAIEFYTRHKDKRTLLWVHYYDPHYAYERHPGTHDFGSDKIDLYDHEIRFTDDQIGRLLSHMRAEGLYDNTAIFVTGDHGEGFGEHGIDLHGYHLYAAQTKVPLIARVPGTQPRRVTLPVAHVDILPTLANLAGAPPTADMQGRSLIDVIAGDGPVDGDRVVFQQLSFENNNEQRGAADRRCHVIFNVSPQLSWEIYRIDRDPNETTDIVDDPGPCSATRTALERFHDISEIPAGAAAALLPAKPTIARALDVRYGGSVRLLQVALPTAPVVRGEAFDMTLTFEALADINRSWKVFAHFETAGGRFLGDHKPVRPTAWWKKGQAIRYTRRVTVPRSTKAGSYRLWFGLFDDRGRAAANAPGKTVRDNAVHVGNVSVTR